MNEKELKQTAVVRLLLAEASAKVRTGGLVDESGEAMWPGWAGTIPTKLTLGEPVPAADLMPGILLPDNVRDLTER